MTKKRGLIGLLVLVIMFMGVRAVGSYNSLIVEESNVDASWAQIENQLQRRNDLIPNLVGSVQGVMGHEQEVFGSIAAARAGLQDASTMEESIEANNHMNEVVSQLVISVEAYPELKANENVTALMDELAGTENRISTERGRFNESVQAFNNKVKQFPTSVFANMAGFEEKPYFEAVEGADQAPVVDFSNN